MKPVEILLSILLDYSLVVVVEVGMLLKEWV